MTLPLQEKPLTIPSPPAPSPAPAPKKASVWKMLSRLITALVLAAILVPIVTVAALFTPGPLIENKTIVIAHGTGAAGIGMLLAQEHAIYAPMLFSYRSPRDDKWVIEGWRI